MRGKDAIAKKLHGEINASLHVRYLNSLGKIPVGKPVKHFCNPYPRFSHQEYRAEYSTWIFNQRLSPVQALLACQQPPTPCTTSSALSCRASSSSFAQLQAVPRDNLPSARGSATKRGGHLIPLLALSSSRLALRDLGGCHRGDPSPPRTPDRQEGDASRGGSTGGTAGRGGSARGGQRSWEGSGRVKGRAFSLPGERPGCAAPLKARSGAERTEAGERASERAGIAPRLGALQAPPLLWRKRAGRDAAARAS